MAVDNSSTEWRELEEDMQLLVNERPTKQNQVIEENKNFNNNKLVESGDMSSELRDFRIKTYKKLTNDPIAKMKYLIKPCVFIAAGMTLVCAGITLTIFHFKYESSNNPNAIDSNPPYFTYGPISFASGIILFMIGIVWFSVKHEKWMKGTATPIARTVAAAAAIAASATLTSEQMRVIRRDSVSGAPQKQSAIV